MKKLQFLIILSLSLIVVSCGDDPLSTSIVDSTWNLVSLEQIGCDDPSENIALVLVDNNNCIEFGGGDLLCDNVLKFSEAGMAVIEFTEDGEADFEEHTYTVNDTNNTITFCKGSSDCNTITVNDGLLTYEIEEGGGCVINTIFEEE